MLRVETSGYTGPLNEEAVAAWLAPFFHPSASIVVTIMERDTVDVTDLSEPEPRAMPTGRASITASVGFPDYPGDW